MAKSYGDTTNNKLRRIVGTLRDERFQTQARVADALGVSPGYVSDFLNEKRGAGLELLVGMSKYAPLQVMEVLGISLPAVINLAAHGSADGAREDERMANLPAPVVRAMRAAIELTGCRSDEAFEAAKDAFTDYGDLAGTDTDWWLSKIRDRLPKRSASGVQPATRIRKATRP